MMMIPEAWQNHESMADDKRRDFYEYHACLMEPWDGPASIAFTDGTVIGAVLDRNGLRPSRYVVTKDGFVVMASEVGVLDIAPENVLYKNRLQPGRMFLVDTEQGRIIDDDGDQDRARRRAPYGTWLKENLIRVADLPEPARGRVDRSARGPAHPPAGLRLQPRGSAHPARADGDQRPGGGRLDGQRHAAGGALQQTAAAVQLLQAALRAGDQPADRPDSRGSGDVDA